MQNFITIPNALSLARIILAPVFCFLFLEGSSAMRHAALVVFTLAAITDLLDGYFARRLGAASSVGAFLDPLADKILVLSVLGCFAMQGILAWWAVVLVASRDLLVTHLRAAALRQGFSLKTTLLAKSKTALQMVAIYAGFIVQTSHIQAVRTMAAAVLWVALALTVYTGIDYLITYMRTLSARGK
jgi:CDP-diacylglycerol--glycerol-3-phosphate 3-phosphatidyltransferase